MELVSSLTCPHCGYAESLTMPVDACQFFHACSVCHVLLRPLPGDCCVFCSYGTTVCPPLQGSPGTQCCSPPVVTDG